MLSSSSQVNIYAGTSEELRPVGNPPLAGQQVCKSDIECFLTNLFNYNRLENIMVFLWQQLIYKDKGMVYITYHQM